MADILKLAKDNLFLMAALDHRNSLKKMLGENCSDEEIISWKKEVLSALAPFASAVLLDPEWGLSAYKGLNLSLPFLLSSEKSGAAGDENGRILEIESSASELKNLGASAVKLLVYYNPAAPSSLKQKETIRQMADDCLKNDIPFLLEIVTYDFGEKKQKGLLVLESVKDILNSGAKIDIFKLEFPENGPDFSSSFSREITQILGATPWIILSAGEDFSVFKEKVKWAIKGGAKGFLAGRSLWQDFSSLPREKWADFFKEVASLRFQEIVSLAKESKLD